MSVPPPPGARRGFLDWKRGILIFCGLLFLFLELGLRVLHLPDLDRMIDPLAFQLEQSPVEAHPYLAYANKRDFEAELASGITVTHNSLGLRGPETTLEKPKHVTRVLCLGDGTTYGSGLSDEQQTYPARLAHYLSISRPEEDFEVLNLGTPGYTTFEGLIDLAVRGIELKPDYVVVCLAGNDARAALHGDPLPDNSHYRAVWPSGDVSGLERFLETSYLYRIARAQLSDWSDTRERFASGLTRRTTEAETEHSAQDPSTRGFRNFRRNLKSIVALSRAAGARVVFCTQPTDRGDYEDSESARALLEAHTRLNSILQKSAPVMGASFADTALVLETEAERQREESGSESLFGYRTGLRAPGADLFALTVADALYRVSDRQ